MDQIFTTTANWDTTITLANMVDMGMVLTTMDTIHTAMAMDMDWTTTSVVTAHTDMEIWVTITQDILGTTT